MINRLFLYAAFAAGAAFCLLALSMMMVVFPPVCEVLK